MSNNKLESMSFREGIDRMVDRATLAIGLNPDTAKIIQARTAAYAVAINKIAQSYYDLGLAEPPKQ